MTDSLGESAADFCRRMRPRLVGTLSLYCGEGDTAEELAQDTLARVWDRWGQVRTMACPEAWAFRVGFNLANSHFRRRAAERRARLRDAPAPEHSSPDPADALAVRQALAGLPKRQRAALVLRFYSDLSVVQTAELMGCAPGTVKSLTHHALAALRTRLGSVELEEVADGG